jgi:hypothetical protein
MPAKPRKQHTLTSMLTATFNPANPSFCACAAGKVWPHHLLLLLLPCPAGVGDGSGASEREFTYYPRLTAMSSMYPDEADAAQATFSLVLNRPQSFSLLEDIGKAVAR